MFHLRENINLTECNTCKTSRYVQLKTSKKKKEIAPKQLVIFRWCQGFKDYTWQVRLHEILHVKDRVLRQILESEVWKTFDASYADFSIDPRNVRLALSTDVFKPLKYGTNHIYGELNFLFIIFPMDVHKATLFIILLLIPSPISLGNNIDIYLRPLVDELKELWINAFQRSSYHYHLFYACSIVADYQWSSCKCNAV